MWVSAVAVLIAIGVPTLRRGEPLLGWLCIFLAAAVLAWTAVAFWRARG